MIKTNLDFLREQRRFEVGLDDQLTFHLLPPHFAHERDDAERQTDVLGRAVAHQVELAVGRNEADAVFGLELAQLDALVELAVVDRDERLPAATSSPTCAQPCNVMLLSH